MRAAAWQVPFAAGICIDPIFMPKIGSAGHEERSIGSKDRIVLQESERLLSCNSTIVSLEARDIRFPTSRWLDGSDAMHSDPDYSAAYVVLRTDADDGVEGHGLTFTSGRGTEVCVAAIRALEPLVVGRSLEAIAADMRGFWRSLASDTQLRWLGPEKGVIHLATAAVVNAVWDLWAKREGKPLWKLLSDMTPEQLVGCVDFRYIADALAPEEAIELLQQARRGAAAREREIVASGYPAYTTSAGWLGYGDSKVESLVGEALAAGFTHVKMKVGADLESDDRRAALIRRALGPTGTLMMDANQVWGVEEAIASMRVLAKHDPWWIEEPTSPDDVLGHARIRRHVAPIRVATGEHVQNRVIFKQLFQAEAIDVCQIDACRIGGVNEAIAVLLLAAKYGIPVCPHASTSSTSPSSTTSPSAARSSSGWSSGSTTCTSTSGNPRSSSADATLRPWRPATASR
jgi:L-fuconate dehydratase